MTSGKYVPLTYPTDYLFLFWELTRIGQLTHHLFLPLSDVSILNKKLWSIWCIKRLWSQSLELRKWRRKALKFHRHHHSCFIFKQSIIYPIPIWSRGLTQYPWDGLLIRHKIHFQALLPSPCYRWESEAKNKCGLLRWTTSKMNLGVLAQGYWAPKSITHHIMIPESSLWCCTCPGSWHFH